LNLQITTPGILGGGENANDDYMIFLQSAPREGTIQTKNPRRCSSRVS